MTTEIRPTGRTWRDLPAEPPFGDLPPPSEPVAEPVPPADPFPPHDPPRRRWPWVVGVLVVLALLVAATLVWALDRGDREPEADAAAPSTTVGVPDAGESVPESEFFLPPGPDVPFPGDEALPPDFLDRFGRNFFDEFAPDLQIPEGFLDQMPEDFFEGFGRDFFEGGEFPLPDDLTQAFPPELADELRRLFDELGSEELFPEGNPFEGLFDELPPDVRDQLPEGLFDQLDELFGAPGDQAPAIPPQFSGNVGLWPTYLPDGYRVSRVSISSTSPDVYDQEIQLEGPAGPILVAIEAGPNRADPSAAPGEPVAVGDAEGRERVALGRRTIVFGRPGATVTIVAPGDADRVELIEIGAGLEETR